ncbi:MAG TPA: hypothetical protein VEY11_12470 [Pyrinomonadaceae bacterium]|nr:hypothetical protein [Pyrinomonadaceae bacterium]
MSKKVFGRILTLCLLAMFVVAGAAPTAARAGRARKKIMPGKNFVLNVGQEVLTSDGKLKIKFVSVAEDSRCPKGVNCIWAGNARVMLQVGKPTGAPVKLELNTNPREATDGAGSGYGQYMIKLVEVAPYPVAEQIIKPQSYAVTLVVSKKS